MEMRLRGHVLEVEHPCPLARSAFELHPLQGRPPSVCNTKPPLRVMLVYLRHAIVRNLLQKFPKGSNRFFGYSGRTPR